MNKKLIKELCSDYEYKITENENDLYLEDLQDESLPIEKTNWEILRLFFIDQYKNKLSYVDKDEETKKYFENIINELQAI